MNIQPFRPLKPIPTFNERKAAIKEHQERTTIEAINAVRVHNGQGFAKRLFNLMGA